MSAYRFCRTDDIGLLVEALNRCWVPCFPGEPQVSAATFKRMIRDLQVWCSSCMVAFSGSDPIAVLVGARRAWGTLVHRIAVHPEHRRQGHGRHLLESLGSKLAILGPPRLVAEVPDELTPACALFSACGFAQQDTLTDYVLERAPTSRVPRGDLTTHITVDDLAATGLLRGADAQVCWHRSLETVVAMKDDVVGLAVASDECVQACLLYVRKGEEAEILSLRSLVDDGGARIAHMLERLQADGIGTFRLSKVHPAEMPAGFLHALGFRPTYRHRRYGAMARPA